MFYVKIRTERVRSYPANTHRFALLTFVCCLLFCFIIIIISSTGTRIRHRSKRELKSKVVVDLQNKKQLKFDLIIIKIDLIAEAI